MRLTRGNGWQLCCGTMLVYAPSYVIGFLLGLTAEVGHPLAALLLIVAALFCTIATLSFLSLVFRSANND
jgi:hypothetical protein